MKKIKIGSVEILGYIGIILWMSINFLRGYHLSDNRVYLFLLGTLPNLAAAWAMTMFAKWFVVLVLKQSFTVKTHLVICLGIVVLAFGSEVVHDLSLGSPFDQYDMLITLIAQIIMFVMAVLTRSVSEKVDSLEG